ncbi:glycosyltransferase family 2 protein [Sphingobacterium chungjuense]|uniref:glycosyltransferase family 2 protein n=1 Tax=Sphingobacterium chungjuense TaxID=2675553 RepID=UPI0014079756|nr:galactosyltransferase-related protein [Sphingobacterium chungjuense]
MIRKTENIAVLTLVHQRGKALVNMLNGIATGSTWPQEVLIIFMNEQPLVLDIEYPFSIRSIVLETDTGLNLGAARNLAMRESSVNYNVFLDVDCIPDKDFLETYYNQLENNSDVLYTGRVRYLPAAFDQTENWTNRLEEISAPDPVRHAIKNYPYELFWSLNFGCSKEVFNKIGGFDMQYLGYGAEDTDFAFQARHNGIALQTIDALAFHQYHASYQPPLNHLESICRNANRFFSKWQFWPMQGWIDAFEKAGYVKKADDNLEIRSLPSDEDIMAALKR